MGRGRATFAGALLVLALLGFVTSASAGPSEAAWHSSSRGFPRLHSAGDPARTTVLSLAVDPTDRDILYAGTEWSLFRSVNGGASWSMVSKGFPHLPSFVPSAAPEIGDVVIGGDRRRTIYVGSVSGGVVKSRDGGTTWVTSNTGLPDGAAGTLSIATLVVHPERPGTVYAAVRARGLFRSDDDVPRLRRRPEWTPLNTGITDPHVHAVAVDSGAADTLYAGTLGGGVFKTVDGGAHWAPANAGLRNRVVSALVADPARPGRVLAGTHGGGVFRTVDGGARWLPVNTGLESAFITALAISPSVPHVLYAGTLGGGVFRSVDRGSHWRPVNDGLTSTLIEALAVNSAGTVFAATRGGGVLVLR